MTLDDLALGIARGRDLAELHAGDIALFGVQQVGGKLRCVAEAKRQKPRGHRIESARMASLLRVDKPAHRLERSVRTHAERLVKEHDAVNRISTPGQVSSPRDAFRSWPCG